jgi:hypothetical protein
MVMGEETIDLTKRIPVQLNQILEHHEYVPQGISSPERVEQDIRAVQQIENMHVRLWGASNQFAAGITGMIDRNYDFTTVNVIDFMNNVLRAHVDDYAHLTQAMVDLSTNTFQELGAVAVHSINDISAKQNRRSGCIHFAQQNF